MKTDNVYKIIKKGKKHFFNILCGSNFMQTYLSNWYSKRIHQYPEQKVCWGGVDPDKTFYLIRRPNDWGLMSSVQIMWSYIAYAKKHGYIPVIDMCNVHNLYLEDAMLGKSVNSWEYYFKQPGGYTVEDIQHAKNVVISSFFIMQDTDKCYYRDWQDFNWETFSDPKIQQKWYKEAHGYFQLTPEAERYIQHKKEEVFGKYTPDEVLGVYCRGTDYMDLQPPLHPVQPSPDEVIKKAKEWMEKYTLKVCYLVTEDERIYQKFVEVFGEDRILSNSATRRSGIARNVDDWIWRRDQGDNRKKNGMDYLANMMLFTNCDYLIGGVTGGIMGFMLLDPKEFKKTYFWNLGLYPNKEKR